MVHILIAEDDKFLANAYRVKLTHEGFEVTVAQNGRETLDALKTIKPALILLDLIMPEVDGFEVLKKLKEQDEYKSIPVIVASNLGQQEDIQKAKALGAVDYIIKSDISMSDLIAKVRSYLK